MVGARKMKTQCNEENKVYARARNYITLRVSVEDFSGVNSKNERRT